MTVGDTTYPMNFDGWKCYFRSQTPTIKDLLKYEIIELTSSRPYEPQRRYTRRVQGEHAVDLTEWRSRLGYPTFDVTKATLDNTTNLIKALQAETREYMRDHYRTRAWVLRPRRINDVMYSDTFVSYICSVWWYQFF